MAIDLVQDFFNTTVATRWASTGAGNFYITVLPDATNGYLVVNRSSSTKREIVKYTGQGTDGGGNYITVAASGDRGQGGTTAQTHELNEAVQMNLTAEHWSDLNDAIDAIVAAGAVDATTSQKGLNKMSVAPAVASSPIAVGDNDPRVLTATEKTYLPTADEKAGLTGLSATNLPVVGDGVTQAGDLQTQTTSTNTIEVGEADATTKKNSLAQSFTATKTKMRGVKLFKKADTGTFTGTVTVSLFADSSGDPTGSALGTVIITNAEWLLLLDDSEFEALFATEYSSVVVGDTYHIDIQPSTSDNSNHPNLGGDTSGGDGTVKYNNITDGWVSLASSYLYYKTMEGVVEQIVKTGDDGKIGSELISVINSAKTILPHPVAVINPAATTSSIVFDLSTVTTQYVGQVYISAPITVNKLSFRTGTVTGTGAVDALDIVLYRDDGTQALAVTNIVIDGADDNIVKTETTTETFLPAGIYYIGVNTTNTGGTQLYFWDTDANIPFSSTEGLLEDVSSKPVIQGTVTISSGTPTVELSPASITSADNSTLIIRLDN